MASPSKSYSLRAAERIHNTTGKDQLGRICVSGFLLESLWHSVVERKFINTPPSVVRKSMVRAAATWPLIYVATAACIKWADWKVQEVEKESN